jgi:ADP-heptose:LPS heptosyltransferase
MIDILAIHSGALGDVILLGQFLQALKAARGGRVRLAATRDKADLLADLDVVDDALDFNALPMDEAFSSRPAEQCALPRLLGRCGLLVSCFAAGDKVAMARLTQLAGAAESLYLPIRPASDYGGHLVEFWAGLTGLAETPPPHWHVKRIWLERAEEALREVGVNPGEPYILIHPGAGSRRKCWPLEKFLALAAQARRDGLLGARQAVFAIGPAEVDWWGEQVVNHIQRQFAVLPATPLPTLAGAMVGAQVYVGNDSGPSHLAAALGASTVTLFGPSNPRHFAPRGPHVQVVYEPDLAGLEVQHVIAAAEMA